MKLRDRLKIAIGIAMRMSDKPSYVLIANLPEELKQKMVTYCDKILEEYKEKLTTETRITIKNE